APTAAPGTEPHHRAAGGAREARVQRPAVPPRPRGVPVEVRAVRGRAAQHVQPGRAVHRPRRPRAPDGRRDGELPGRVPRRRAGAVPRAPVPQARPRGRRTPVRRHVLARLDGARRDADPRAGPRRLRPVARARVGRRAAEPAVPARGRRRQAGDARDVARGGAAQRRQRRGRLRPADLRDVRRQDRPVRRRGQDGHARPPELRRPQAAAGAAVQPRPGQGEAARRAVRRRGAGAVRAARRPPRGRRHRRQLDRLGPPHHHAQAVRPRDAGAAVPHGVPDGHRGAARRRGARRRPARARLPAQPRRPPAGRAGDPGPALRRDRGGPADRRPAG
ncbi:MAG: Glutamyl-tRNA reductase, partial [uncultured Phycisphaerae bacterium]